MSLIFSVSEFLEAGPHCEAFDQLLFQATSQKSALALSLAPSQVKIHCEAADKGAIASLSLSGLSQYVLDRRVPNAAQVFYPLLGQVQSFKIPAAKIFALRSHNRSVADFWARNLFHTLSSTSDVDCTETSENLKGDGPTAMDGLTKSYLWVLRDALPDSNLKCPDVFEKLTLDFYFPVIAYENQILKGGMKTLRELNATTLEDQRASDEERQAARRFSDCRSDLLALLAS
ncbi:MAG: hypothetical protein ACE37M_08255 [Henriciella sp.]